MSLGKKEAVLEVDISGSGVTPKIKPKPVTTIMPIIIAPLICRIIKALINMIPSAANRGSG